MRVALALDRTALRRHHVRSANYLCRKPARAGKSAAAQPQRRTPSNDSNEKRFCLQYSLGLGPLTSSTFLHEARPIFAATFTSRPQTIYRISEANSPKQRDRTRRSSCTSYSAEEQPLAPSTLPASSPSSSCSQHSMPAVLRFQNAARSIRQWACLHQPQNNYSSLS